mgnify:FL=1|jgi:hypothetical protein|tara:strand:+ start:1283 stop:3103 length:1821 start_codon:yes stop_codon:yes gene_type:complete
MMRKVNNSKQKISFSSEDLLLSLNYSNKIFVDKLVALNSNFNFLNNKNNDLLKIKLENKFIPSNQTNINKVFNKTDNNYKVVSIDFSQHFKKDFFKGRISILQKKENIIDLILQLAVKWKNRIPKKTLLTFPFLTNLYHHKNFLKAGHIFNGKNLVKKSTWSFHEYPPSILTDDSANFAVGIEFFDQFPWQSNYNLGMHEAISKEGFEKYEAEIQLTEELSDVVVMRFYTSSEGKNKVFNLWKENIRSRYDLRKYFRPKNRWIKKNYLQHFTFAYGKEAFEYKKTKFKINKIIKEGKEFGGYDSIIFWHQYPRLGLDNTNQWELYRYLPEDYKSIKKIVKECHLNNIKFFIPFKPWDVRSNESLDKHAKFLENFIIETNIDGFFLDTMSSLPESFLRIQKKFPSFEFCSEGTPKEQRQIEQLTSSWDQIGDIRRNYKVEVETNMFRFVFPEHPLNLVSRWSVGSDKDSIIKRAAFNGTGLVIWQDVFGCWLPFSKKQKQLIKQLKKILVKFHDIFFGNNSIPLIETLSKGIICNQFANDNQRIYSIYNFTSKKIKGPLFSFEYNADIKVQQIYGKMSSIIIKQTKKLNSVCSTIDPNEVILIHVKY